MLLKTPEIILMKTIILRKLRKFHKEEIWAISLKLDNLPKRRMLINKKRKESKFILILSLFIEIRLRENPKVEK